MAHLWHINTRYWKVTRCYSVESCKIQLAPHGPGEELQRVLNVLARVPHRRDYGFFNKLEILHPEDPVFTQHRELAKLYWNVSLRGEEYSRPSKDTLKFFEAGLLEDFLWDCGRSKSVQVSEVLAGQGLIVTSGGCEILVYGDVGPDATVFAEGGSPSIYIVGDVHPGARVYCGGAGARVIVGGRVHDGAAIVASGAGAALAAPNAHPGAILSHNGDTILMETLAPLPGAWND